MQVHGMLTVHIEIKIINKINIASHKINMKYSIYTCKYTLKMVWAKNEIKYNQRVENKQLSQ